MEAAPQANSVWAASFTKDTGHANPCPRCRKGPFCKDELFFVEDKRAGNGEGRLLCKDCYDYYKHKGSSKRREDVDQSHYQVLPLSSASAAAGRMRQVSNGMRGVPTTPVQAVGPGPIVAVPGGRPTMQTYGPSVPHMQVAQIDAYARSPLLNAAPHNVVRLPAPKHVQPMVTQTGALSAISGLNLQGYTPNHLQYGAHRARMVSNSMHSSLRELVPLQFEIVTQPEGKKKGEMWGNLFEGVHGVDAHIGSVQLANLGFESLREKWHKRTCGFPVEDPAAFFVLRDSGWAKLAGGGMAAVQYDVIYERFLVESRRKGVVSVAFRAPKNPWVVQLELEPDKLAQVEAHIEEIETRQLAISPLGYGKIAELVLDPNAGKNKKRLHVASPTKPAKLRKTGHDKHTKLPTVYELSDSDCEVSESKKNTTPARTTPRKPTPRPFSTRRTPTQKRSGPSVNNTLHGQGATGSPGRVMSSRSLQTKPLDDRGTLRSSPIDILPNPEPLAASAHAGHVILASRARGAPASSVPRATLTAALKALNAHSASAIEDILSLDAITVEFHPVAALPYADLCRPGDSGLEIILAQVPATLRLKKTNKNAKLGTFKKAWFGTISSRTDSILGAPAGEVLDVCAKQTVYATPADPQRRIPHTGTKQARLLHTEARCLVWARALLQEVYVYLDELVKEVGEPAFEIPWDLDFVEAGLCKDSTGNVYLVERTIEGRFVKYINNDSPMPLRPKEDLKDGEAIYAIAEFLSFTQHVQFILTEGVVFVTDYQGSGKYLTDPQIVTHPRLGDQLFAMGNSGYDVFVKRHVCNHFCRHFRLEPVVWPSDP